MPQRDADLLHLWTMVERAAPGQPKAAALARLSAEASKRVVTDAAVRCAVHALLHRRRTGALLQVRPCASSVEHGLLACVLSWLLVHALQRPEARSLPCLGRPLALPSWWGVSRQVRRAGDLHPWSCLEQTSSLVAKPAGITPCCLLLVCPQPV